MPIGIEDSRRESRARLSARANPSLSAILAARPIFQICVLSTGRDLNP